MGTISRPSAARRVSVALEVSSVSGGAAGAGGWRPRRASVFVFGAMSAKRTSTGPVRGEPSAFFATGTEIVSTFGAAARSPCHPLVSTMWPNLNRSAIAPARAVAAGSGARPRFGNFVEQNSAGLRKIDRDRDRKRRRILHHSPRIARREFDVGDDGIERTLRIQLAVNVAAEPFVWADMAEVLALKGRGVVLLDHDANNSRVRGRDQQRGRKNVESRRVMRTMI